jgi:alkanesulfonate monooxygenase SsuD/methylene tetrahydromethanopterin reductase-like flavin-dependent oxidoreductase (luciferase family)
VRPRWRTRNDIRDIAAKAGRDSQAVKVLAQIMPVVAATDAEAEEKWVTLQQLIHPDLNRGAIESMLGEDSAATRRTSRCRRRARRAGSKATAML